MECNCFNRGEENCIEIVPIFSNLTKEEMLEIASITTEKTFQKGELIYMSGDQGDKLYVIHSGKVKISRITDSGKEQVIRILGPGEFMGELSIFSSLPLKDNGEAIENTTMCRIDGQLLKSLLLKYPTISFKIMEELSQRLEKAEELVENISIHGVERRIAEALMGLADTKGDIKLKMSKKDLSSHLGMSQETLSRKLRIFEDKGFIKQVGHRKINILDREALSKIE